MYSEVYIITSVYSTKKCWSKSRRKKKVKKAEVMSGREKMGAKRGKYDKMRKRTKILVLLHYGLWLYALSLLILRAVRLVV